MPSTKDITVEDIKLAILVYGASGTGKTHFLGTFPKPYVADFDDGLLTLGGVDPPIDYDTYHDVVVNGVLQKSAWQAFDTKLLELEKECPYETLAVDSITTLQESAMAQILKVNSRSVPTLYEWGRLIDWLQGLFRRLRAFQARAGTHLVVTAHEQIIKDEILGNVLVQPLIVGKKLPGQLPLFFDEVYRLQVSEDKGEVSYQMMTTATTRYSAKSRLGVLDTMEVPDYKVIMGKVR